MCVCGCACVCGTTKRMTTPLYRHISRLLDIKDERTLNNQYDVKRKKKCPNEEMKYKTKTKGKNKKKLRKS